MPRTEPRVTPFRTIIATPKRGTVFGNRGVLHDDTGRRSGGLATKRWLLCLLRFKGRQRQIMTPGRYTELFFLDEATGLAAGHRPCAECRRDDYLAFRSAWPSGCRSAVELDDQLHAERLNTDDSQRRFDADLRGLPDGVMVMLPGDGETARLLWRGRLLRWSAGGYDEPLRRPSFDRVSVLTPISTVAAIRAGYQPAVHPSADGS